MEKDYTSFMEANEDGSFKLSDTSKLDSYIDSMVSKGVESYKTKLAKEQERAKMTEQEQYAEKLKEIEQMKLDWENEKKTQMKAIISEKAKTKLSTNFSKKEIELFLTHITDNEKESMKYIDAIVEERNNFIEETKKKLIEELQSNEPKTKTQANSNNGSSNRQEVKKTSQQIKDMYK